MSTAAAARVNWTVGTGASYASYADQGLDFYPKAITINANDTITFTIGSGVGGDAHTVAFVPKGMAVPGPGDPNNLNPTNSTNRFATVDGSKFVNSGILTGSQNYTMQFPKAGTYKLYCLFHEPAMVMNVVVQNAGTPYPHTAAFYANISATSRWDDFMSGQRAVQKFPFANGGTTFAAGIDESLAVPPPPTGTILRFINSNNFSIIRTAGNATVKVGTTLTFVNMSSNEPHTVTFALAGQTDLPNIPTDPAVNVVPPPGVTTIDGSKIVNSGSLIGPVKGANSFSVRFIKAGTYFYGCLYHDNSRMTGTITVKP